MQVGSAGRTYADKCRKGLDDVNLRNWPTAKLFSAHVTVILLYKQGFPYCSGFPSSSSSFFLNIMLVLTIDELDANISSPLSSKSLV
jgi:hypothetical protein